MAASIIKYCHPFILQVEAIIDVWFHVGVLIPQSTLFFMTPFEICLPHELLKISAATPQGRNSTHLVSTSSPGLGDNSGQLLHLGLSPAKGTKL
jgi:hypothetical protein